MVSHGLPAQTPRKQRFSSVPRDLSVSGTQRCFVDAREVLFPRRQLLEASFLHIMPLAPWSGRRRLCLAVPRSGGPFSSSSDRGIEEMALGLPPCTQTFSLPVTVHPLVLAMVSGEAADLTFFFFLRGPGPNIGKTLVMSNPNQYSSILQYCHHSGGSCFVQDFTNLSVAKDQGSICLPRGISPS